MRSDHITYPVDHYERSRSSQSVGLVDSLRQHTLDIRDLQPLCNNDGVDSR